MFDKISGDQIAKVLGILFMLYIFGEIVNVMVIPIALFLLWTFIDHNSDDEDEIIVSQQKAINSSRKPQGESVFPHALAAVREAGLNPERLAVLPVDIGLIAFYGNDEPELHHTRSIPDDSDYIQPFVQLRVPHTAIGQIRFEVLDHYGQPVFVHEDRYQLERGRNLVMPSARIPLHDEQNTSGVWELCIYADNRLIARHIFGWDSAQAPNFERHIGEDGELNSELRAILAQSRLADLSLDELLAHQDQDDFQQEQR